MNQTMNANAFMQEEDLLYTILCDLKRTVREYATAATESACPSVRQMFTQLTNNTLRLQGELYTLMSQQNMYPTGSKALRKDIDQQLQQSQSTQQKTQQFIQQKTGGAVQFNQAPTPTHQANAQSPYYM